VVFCKQSGIADLRQWYIFPAGKCFGGFSPKGGEKQKTINYFCKTPVLRIQSFWNSQNLFSKRF
jgi:hypothetical protein